MRVASSRRSNRDAKPIRVRDGPLKFSGDNAFHQELRRRVDAEFERVGCTQRDSAKMYLKAVLILGVFVRTYVALVCFATSIWQASLPSTLLGIATAGIGFNIMHDGGDQAYSDRCWINRLLATAVDVIGGQLAYKGMEARPPPSHLGNVAGYDSDIDLGVMARLSPLQRRRPWHRRQHFYLWFLHGVIAIR